MTYLKKAWHWLTSMRTALALLFLLAVAAIPGALLPQRSLNETNVIEYIENNGRLAEVYDRLQLFDVFESTWFLAILVLLTLSLIGCILPRSWDHYVAWKTPPTRAPKNLARLPLRAEGGVDKPLEEVAADARGRGIALLNASVTPQGYRCARERYADHLKRCVDLAAALGIPLVGTFIGRDPAWQPGGGGTP